MNYITVIAKDATKYTDNFLSSLEKFGGADEDDTLVVICSKWTPEFNDEFKEAVSPYFTNVVMAVRSLVPFGEDSVEVYSEKCFCQSISFVPLQGPSCYIPMGSAVTEKGWSKKIADGYTLGKRRWAGSTYVFDKEAGLTTIKGSFVTDAYHFYVIPMFKTFSKKDSLLVRARFYVNQSVADIDMPFSSELVINEPYQAPEKPKDEFDVDAPKKVSTLSTGAKKPAAKKAAKKVTKKTAKKKTAKKAVSSRKPPISADVIDEALKNLS